MTRQTAMLAKTKARSESKGTSGVGLEGPHHAKLAAISGLINGAAVQRQPLQAAPNQTGLPDQLKAGVEALSGLSMDDVRVHRNSSKPATLQANAYAQGRDIHLGPGQERHLPHEAWHVVQQAQGRVRATRQMSGGMPINDDAGLEHEADVMGARALRSGGATPAPLARAAATIPGGVAQGNLFNKLVGNTFSDLALKGGIAAVSYVSGLAGRLKPNQPWYGPLTGRGFGTVAEVRSDRENLSTEPSVTNSTWEALQLRRLPDNRSYYIRGHLINRHLGGPGTTWQNLTPLTERTNKAHSSQVEQIIKGHATSGTTIDYRVQAIYGQWPWHWPSYLSNLVLTTTAKPLLGGVYEKLAALKDAEQHIPVQLDTDWWYGGKHFQKSVHQQPNTEGGFWVTFGGHNYDLSRESALWGLIEGGLATGFKSYLLPALVPHLAVVTGPAAAHALLSLAPVKCLQVVTNYFGGQAAITSRLARAGWSVPKFVEQLTPVALEGIAELAARASGSFTLPSLSAKDPVPANREAINTLGSLHDDERNLLLSIKNDKKPGPGLRTKLHSRAARPVDLSGKSKVVSDEDRYN